MKKGKTKAGQTQALRDRAEALVGGKPKDIARLSAEEIQKLVHELQVHQIELEMQNEELRKSQLELEEARSKYYDLYDFAPVGYLTLDAKGLIEEINLAGAELLGAERISVNKKPLSRFIAPDYQDAYYLHRNGVLESRTRQTCELKLVSKKGIPRYVQMESIAAEDAGGRPNQIRAVISDITERRRVQEDLALADARQKAQLNLYGMADAPLKEVVKFVVEECVKLSKSTLAFVGFVNEDETIMSAHLWSEKAMAECLITDKPTEFSVTQGGLWAESIRQHRPIIANDYRSSSLYKKGLPEGHALLSRFMGVPVLEGERVVVVAGVANKEQEYSETDLVQITLLLQGMWGFVQRRKADEILRKSRDEFEKQVGERTAELTTMNEELRMEIAERKRAEEATRESEKKYCSVIENSLTGIAIEQDGKIVFANKRFAQIYGYAHEELTGMVSSALLHPEDRAIANSLKMQQLSGEEAFAEYELRNVTKRGEIIWVKTRSAPIDYQGKAALLTNAVDVTGRKAVEEALRVSEKELRVLASRLMTAQEDERKRIALELHDGTVATLAAIKFSLETTLMQPAKERDKEQGSLKNSISMLQRSIDEIRRTMSNLRPSILDDLGILATINWYCREYQKVYTEIPVEKEIGIDEDEIPDSLKIAIFRVMQEAMNNVAKHSKAGRLNLSLRKVNGAIELSVEDNGQGFDVPGALDQETGLGIYSMRERIRLSGGIFSIESLKGKGTSVRATWPI